MKRRSSALVVTVVFFGLCLFLYLAWATSPTSEIDPGESLAEQSVPRDVDSQSGIDANQDRNRVSVEDGAVRLRDLLRRRYADFHQLMNDAISRNELPWPGRELAYNIAELVEEDESYLAEIMDLIKNSPSRMKLISELLDEVELHCKERLFDYRLCMAVFYEVGHEAAELFRSHGERLLAITPGMFTMRAGVELHDSIHRAASLQVLAAWEFLGEGGEEIIVEQLFRTESVASFSYGIATLLETVPLPGHVAKLQQWLAELERLRGTGFPGNNARREVVIAALVAAIARVSQSSVGDTNTEPESSKLNEVLGEISTLLADGSSTSTRQAVDKIQDWAEITNPNAEQASEFALATLNEFSDDMRLMLAWRTGHYAMRGRGGDRQVDGHDLARALDSYSKEQDPTRAMALWGVALAIAEILRDEPGTYDLLWHTFQHDWPTRWPDQYVAQHVWAGHGAAKLLRLDIDRASYDLLPLMKTHATTGPIQRSIVGLLDMYANRASSIPRDRLIRFIENIMEAELADQVQTWRTLTRAAANQALWELRDAVDEAIEQSLGTASEARWRAMADAIR